MALIACGECGKEISDRASACPHCGNPMQPVEMRVVAPTPVKVQSEGCFLQTMNLGCGIVVAIIALIFIVAVMR